MSLIKAPKKQQIRMFNSVKTLTNYGQSKVPALRVFFFFRDISIETILVLFAVIATILEANKQKKTMARRKLQFHVSESSYFLFMAIKILHFSWSYSFKLTISQNVFFFFLFLRLSGDPKLKGFFFSKLSSVVIWNEKRAKRKKCSFDCITLHFQCFFLCSRNNEN